MMRALAGLPILAAAACLLGAGTGTVRAQDTLGRPTVRGSIARILGAGPSEVTRAAAGRIERVSPSVDSLRVRPGVVVAIHLGDIIGRSRAAADGGPSRLTLPRLYIVISASGRDTLLLRPDVLADELQYDDGAGVFRGVLQLGLLDSLEPSRTDRFLTPIRFLLSAPGADIQPREFAIDHANLPYTTVRLRTPLPEDTLRLRIRDQLDPHEVVAPIAVRRTLIALEPVSRSIPGLGLGATAIHVTLPAEAGPGPKTVRLRALRGTPDPSTVPLTGGATADVKIRAVGLGRDTVSAQAGPLRAVPVEIVYQPPVLFLLAALVGGVVGSLVAAAQSRRRGRAASRGRYSVSGLAAGLLVAVAFAIGLNLTGVAIPPQSGEAVVFVVAALGAMLGLRGIATAVPALDKMLQGKG